jgi:hypothetical protein
MGGRRCPPRIPKKGRSFAAKLLSDSVFSIYRDFSGVYRCFCSFSGIPELPQFT